MVKWSSAVSGEISLKRDSDQNGWLDAVSSDNAEEIENVS